MSEPSTLFIPAANTGPALREVWAFISRGPSGKENVLGAKIGALGMQPMITGNPDTFAVFYEIAKLMRTHLEGSEQTIHLMRFSVLEEIKQW